MKTLFEESVPGRVGCLPDKPEREPADMIPAGLLRNMPPRLPELSELDVVRHFTRLSQQNFGVDSNFYPLGSCTMKYNPKFTEHVAAMEGFTRVHPLLAQIPGGEAFTQGALQCLWEMEEWLKEITGMAGYTLQPMAGANGEFTGAKLIGAYHKARGNKKTKIIIPDSAHGTNPASAVLAGFEIINIESKDGMIDPDTLQAALTDDVAALMMTCPNTLGLFETHLPAIVEKLHSIDALLYYDGANMNAILGQMRVGDVGFDVVHLNIHKTMATPHGGGGPGAGPVGVSEKLLPFLPVPRVEKRADGTFFLNSACPESIGHIAACYGNFGVLLRGLAYLKRLGAEGLKRASTFAVLNANYLRALLQDMLEIPYNRICMHEFVASAPGELHALDIAKGLLDRGFHAPTIYFPLIVKECIMPEPTESESKQTLDEFADAVTELVALGHTAPERLHAAPETLPVGRLDEAAAARHMILTEDQG